MEDHNTRPRSYTNGMMQIESYHGPPAGDLRSHSASYAQQNQVPRKAKGSSSKSKSWSFSDPEFQRKKRVASYKRYSVEGKVKGSLRRSFTWLKHKCTQVVYGWW